MIGSKIVCIGCRFWCMKVRDEVANHCRFIKSLHCYALLILEKHQRPYVGKCKKIT